MYLVNLPKCPSKDLWIAQFRIFAILKFLGMDKFLGKVTILISLIFAICISSLFLADTSGAVVTPPKTKCFIEVQNAHIATSILEQQGRLAVKVNAKSYCNFPQSNVILTVKIFKEGLVAPHLVAQGSTRAENPKSKGFVVKNQFTFAFCKNTTKSMYYGVASARATIRGKTYITPPVWSEKTLELDCGT